MFHLRCCERVGPSFAEDELDWNAATNDLLLEAERGESRALCRHCRHPLRWNPGQWIPGTAECTKSGQTVSLTEPHFSCLECEAVVSVDEGPRVYIDREYDMYDAETQTFSAKDSVIGHKGQVHVRTRDVQFMEPGSKRIAQDIFSKALALGQALTKELEDASDSEWHGEDLLTGITAAQVLQLCESAQAIFAAQPVLVEAAAPCMVFGDTHGQLRDVLLHFNAWGWPGKSGEHVVFNGDVVDRGDHQVELVLIVLALKVLHPTSVWMVRGNHEDPEINKRYGFEKSCLKAFAKDGPKVFQAFHGGFAQLPLGCRIAGKILAVHGGLGDGRWSLDDLRRVRRPLTHAGIHADPMVFNILWSDPIEDDDPKEEHTYGVHSSPRSKEAKKFGWDVTSVFCKRNQLELVIRSHQTKKHGYGFDVMHDQMLVRVFSARDYEHSQNDGAVLSIREDPKDLLVVRARVLKSRTS